MWHLPSKVKCVFTEYYLAEIVLMKWAIGVQCFDCDYLLHMRWSICAGCPISFQYVILKLQVK